MNKMVTRLLMVLTLILSISLFVPLTSFASGALDDSYTPTIGNGGFDIQSSSASQIASQKFVPSHTGDIDHITVNMKKVGSPAGHAYINIYSDSSGHPGSLLFSSNTLSQSSLSSSYANVDFSFPSSSSVTSGTSYWFGVTSDNGVNSSNYMNISAVSPTYRADEQNWNGSSWNVVVSNYSLYFAEYYVTAPTATPTPTPTPLPASIAVSPASQTVTVGTPFTVTINANGNGAIFNAALATVNISSNLAVTNLMTPTSTGCNFTYTQTPTAANPSFVGGILGSSKTSCTVYRLTLTPTSSGTGTITITNPSLKSYADSIELSPTVVNGSFTINAATATPTPTTALTNLTLTSPSETYNSSFTLTGAKDTGVTSVFVNGSTTGVTFPTSTTWHKSVTLSSGLNSFLIYGSDGNGNLTGTINAPVSLHTLGDINGDGVIDIIDFSLFASDWGNTGTLNHILSDMNNDSSIDLTDFSILARLEAQ